MCVAPDAIKNHTHSILHHAIEHSRSGSRIRPHLIPTRPSQSVHGAWYRNRYRFSNVRARCNSRPKPTCNTLQGKVGCSLHEKRALARLWHPSKVERLSDPPRRRLLGGQTRPRRRLHGGQTRSPLEYCAMAPSVRVRGGPIGGPIASYGLLLQVIRGH